MNEQEKYKKENKVIISITISPKILRKIDIEVEKYNANRSLVIEDILKKSSLFKK